MAAKKKDLKATVEEEIKAMLGKSEEPSEGRMKLIALAIKMAALNAKLEENEYGDFFNRDDESTGAGGAKGEKSVSGKRANGSADPA